MLRPLCLLILFSSVFSHPKAWAGCAANRNDGKVYCAPGDCAINLNDGKVYCSAYAGGPAAASRNDGKVYCGKGPNDTSNSISTDNCIEAK